MTSGTVEWFNATKGYGFIQPDQGGPDAFVHIPAVERSGMDTLREGERIRFALARGRNRKSAAENLSHGGCGRLWSTRPHPRSDPRLSSFRA